MKVVITGSAGMLGREIVEAWGRLRPQDILIPLTREILDLSNGEAVEQFVAHEKPDLIVHTAALVRGISERLAHPTRFLVDNVLIDAHVINSARTNGVKNFIYMSSAAIYPEADDAIFIEKDILSGPMERASESYGLAKLVGTTLCSAISQEDGLNYRALIPCNIFGREPLSENATSHLLGAALSKTMAAVRDGGPVEIWGDGTSRREFVAATDIAEWIASSADNFGAWHPIMNIGLGEDHSITEYYRWAAEVVGYTGDFVFASDKPNGVRRRLLDSSLARALGWNPQQKPKTGLQWLFDAREDSSSG
ncbi:MAG: NAD-dependent epimerase/dehydratase family protein [Actinobacteria bacterium]|uniref:Unannotated protein n=1 Tax=freshwater metagenome TaxID=449393 RepID=A0A6J7FQV9_9ZZZZ|nr:NAD-dependent epimerase/dehydratase family protein [Actinomycetota bacterium]